MRALLRARRGTAAVEFALVAPILLALSTGCVGLTQAVRARMDVAQAAQTMAQLIATQSSVTTAQIADFCTGADAVMTPFAATGLGLAIASVTRNASSGTVRTDWTDTSCGNAAAIAAPATLAASVVPNNGDSAIVVQASYTLANPLSLVLPASFTFSAVAFARPRGNATIAKN
ncbi:MAG: pilus assembly protein [Rhodospirillales bacterium]|nr:pilus assembly protein [Rhodospirillales bacterium]